MIRRNDEAPVQGDMLEIVPADAPEYGRQETNDQSNEIQRPLRERWRIRPRAVARWSLFNAGINAQGQ